MTITSTQIANSFSATAYVRHDYLTNHDLTKATYWHLIDVNQLEVILEQASSNLYKINNNLSNEDMMTVLIDYFNETKAVIDRMSQHNAFLLNKALTTKNQIGKENVSQ